MKHKKNPSSTTAKTTASPAAVFQRTLAMLISCLTLNAPAEVQVTKFDPPLAINSFSEVPDNLWVNITAFDFNLDGEIDFRLAHGYGAMEAFFNAPTRFARREGRPGVTVVGGPVAAVPLRSLLGGNLVAAGTTNRYVWSPGYTNRYDLTQPFGNHEASVIIANMTTTGMQMPVISISSNGVLTTNYYGGPVVSGDIAGKEGVMALEFYINGQPHYGYIHFDFRSPRGTPFGGAAGVIHGWAYETLPGRPIKAIPLSETDARERREDRWNDHDQDDRGDKARGRNSR